MSADLIGAASKNVDAAVQRVEANHEPSAEDRSAAAELLHADGKSDHFEVVATILAAIRHRRLAVDAVEAFRHCDSWSIAGTSAARLAREVTFHMRTSGRIDTGVLIETTEEIVSRLASARRAKLIRAFTGAASTARGRLELSKLVQAITGGTSATDMAVMLHFIWMVKRKATGRKAEAHIMAVLVGKQGGGKSEAVLRLLAPLLELADLDMTVDRLCDERSGPILAMRLVGLMDEMSGLSRADANRLKQRISGTEVSYRPMRSNQVATVPHRMSFIGTSNDPLASIFKDATGNRRFYEMRTLDRCDWPAINSIDAELIWREAVSEDDPAPAVQLRSEIAAVQAGQRYRDAVELFLEDYDNSAGAVLTASAYSAFRAWCDDHGERSVVTDSQFGQRLQALGWERKRMRVDGRPLWHYLRPVPSVPSVPSAGLYQSGNDASNTTLHSLPGQRGVPLGTLGTPGTPQAVAASIAEESLPEWAHGVRP